MIATLAPRLANALDEIQIDLTSSEAQLTERLYAVLHAGLQSTEPAIKRDRWLEEALAEAVPHSTTPVTAIVRTVGDDELIVEWDGVLVRIPTVGQASVGDPITFPAPPVRLALSPGFLLVTGSREVDLSGPVLRVYVHLTDPHNAVNAWHAVLNVLENEETAYQAKVLSRASQYPRRDAIVVYLSEESAARLVAEAVDGMPGIGSGTSVLADQLSPGVATAWEPTDTRPGHTGLSFGQHRCAVLARALLEADETPRDQAIINAFVAAGIDPANPALNRAGAP